MFLPISVQSLLLDAGGEAAASILRQRLSKGSYCLPRAATYVFPRRREPDLQISRHRRQTREVCAPVDRPVASRAKADEVPAGGGQWFVVRHAQRGRLRSTTAHAINFSGFAGAFILDAFTGKEGGQIVAQDQL
jgi:hypothetical protein